MGSKKNKLNPTLEILIGWDDAWEPLEDGHNYTDELVPGFGDSIYLKVNNLNGYDGNYLIYNEYGEENQWNLSNNTYMLTTMEAPEEFFDDV